MTHDAMIEGVIWFGKLAAFPAIGGVVSFWAWVGLTTLENQNGVEQNAIKNMEQESEISVALKEIRDARVAEMLIHAEENTRLGVIEGQLELLIQQIQE